jgi:hypothetical protein
MREHGAESLAFPLVGSTASLSAISRFAEIPKVTTEVGV